MGWLNIEDLLANLTPIPSFFCGDGIYSSKISLLLLLFTYTTTMGMRLVGKRMRSFYRFFDLILRPLGRILGL